MDGRNFHRKRLEDLAKTCKGVQESQQSHVICREKRTRHALEYLGIVNNSKYQDGSKDSSCLNEFDGEKLPEEIYVTL